MLLISVFIFCSVLYTCSSKKNEIKKDVMIAGTTILPVKQFIEKIAGSSVEIVLMVPPGANPHVYELTPKQMTMLNNATVYFKLGTGVEFELKWMNKLVKLNPRMKMVNVSEGIKLIAMSEKHQHETSLHKTGLDPHVWTSPDNALIIAQNIYKGLCAINPSMEKTYKENLDKLILDINKTKNTIVALLENVPSRKFMVFHPSWGYFAKEFNLQQITIEAEGKETSPLELKNLIDFARKENIRIIIVSPEFSVKSAQIVANGINGSLIAISNISGNWNENLIEIAKAVALKK